MGRSPSTTAVLINLSIWSKHASPTGIACLFVCLAAAGTYQQAPKRADSVPSEVVRHADGHAL